MQVKTGQKTRIVRVNSLNTRSPLPFTSRDVRVYVKEHTRTPEAFDAFLYSIGYRRRRNGAVYVVPI